MLVLAPLFWGGNRPLPLFALEVLGLLALVLTCWSRRPVVEMPVAFKLGWLGVFLVPFIQLVPCPPFIWELLSPRAALAEVSVAAGLPMSSWLPISAVPSATEAALWSIVPMFATFLVAFAGSPSTQRKLLIIMVAMAGAQAVLGLLQFVQGPISPWRFGNPFYGDGGVGTYANRNHLAGFLEMAMMVALGLCFSAMQPIRRLAGRDAPGQRLARWWSTNFEPLASYGALAVLCAVGLAFTKSKAGFALMIVGFVAAALVYQGRGYRRVGLTMFAFAILVTVLMAGLGVFPTLERLLFSDYLRDARWPLFVSTVQGALQGLPLGNGVGTYVFTYPPYQPDGVPGLANHAHNDYLEWFFEGGIPALALMVLGLWVFIRQWMRLLGVGHWNPQQRVRVGVGLGLLLVLLHGLVDFNLRIPANAIFFCLLAGVFFSPERSAPATSGSTPVRRTRRMPAPSTATAIQAQPNPFA